MGTAQKSEDANLELVIAMGSKKGYDPIPPDNYLFFLTSEDEVQRVLAYVRSKTIRKGHRSPFAVTEGARPVTKADMARERFGGDRANACRAWDRTAAMGLVFENEKGFLCLAGSVKIRPLERRTKGEPLLSAQTALRPYQIEKIEALPEATRNAFNAHHAKLIVYREALETDALTLARIRGDQIEDSMFRHYGIPKRRLDRKHRPELRDAGSKLLQMELLLVPEELQPFAESAQTAPVQTSRRVSTDRENGSVQTAHTAIEVQRKVSSPAASSLDQRKGSSSSSKEAIETTTTLPISDLDEREFHTRLCRQFQEAGKDVPVRKQSSPIYAKVGSHAQEFLGWLTPKKLTRVKHPGALPDLVEEFLLMIKALPSPPPTEEERQRQEAEEVMRDPGGFDEETRGWAEKFLGGQKKGATS